jgi:hypothetical protein
LTRATHPTLSLHIIPLTPAVKKELDLIDVAYYAFQYSPTVLPMQVRFAKSQFDLMRLLLESNPRAHKDPNIALELSRKLRSDNNLPLSVVTLATLLRSAIRDHDYKAAMSLADKLRKSFEELSKSKDTDAEVSEAKSLAWECLKELCHSDILISRPEKQLEHVTGLITLCPEEELPSILDIWQQANVRVHSTHYEGMHDLLSGDGQVHRERLEAILLDEHTNNTLTADGFCYHEFYYPTSSSTTVYACETEAFPIRDGTQDARTLGNADLIYWKWKQTLQDEDHTNDDIHQASLSYLAHRDSGLWLARQAVFWKQVSIEKLIVL